MNNSSTVSILNDMHLGAMSAELTKQMKDPNAYGKLGFEERIGLMVDAEWNKRQQNKLARYVRNAHFSISSASVDEIEYYEDRRLDKAQMLRFSTCKYLEEGRHIILRGASGNGKTYIACALGNAACKKFKSVRYIRMPELLDELSVARACGDFKKAVKSYQKADLLIIDEWLIRCLILQEAYDLLEIVEARCSKKSDIKEANGSMIFCTQFELAGWYDRINPDLQSDSPISEAIIDRIMHNAYDVPVDGKVSMREHYGLKAKSEISI